MTNLLSNCQTDASPPSYNYHIKHKSHQVSRQNSSSLKSLFVKLHQFQTQMHLFNAFAHLLFIQIGVFEIFLSYR